MDDDELLAELKSWKGTRWIHGQCVKGVGTDCVRFVIAVGKMAGWVPEDYKPPMYNQDWAMHNEVSILEQEIVKFADQIHPPFRVGDIFLFVYGKCTSHAGIYIGRDRMVHSYRGQGVVESEIRRYLAHFHSAWRPRGI